MTRLSLILALGVGCTSAPEALEDTASPGYQPLSWPVDAPGEFNVGYRGWSETYTPLGETEPRTIGVNLWYPTEATDGDDVAYLDAFPDPDALGGAPLAAPAYADGYPVHVHSHGYQGWGGTSSDLMRYYASHGWVVVAPDHTNNLLTDHTDPLATAHYLHRPQDVRVALDAVGADTELDGAANLNAVILSGHSFGAYTVWAASGATYDMASVEAQCVPGGAFPTGQCTDTELEVFASGDLHDPRVVASIPLAGTIDRVFFGESGQTSIDYPVMTMSGSADNPEGSQRQWEEMHTLDFTWVELEGGCHQTFALGACSTLDPAEGFAIVNTYALAMGRVYVLGDHDPTALDVLEGAAQVSDKVTFQRMNAP